MSNLKQLKKFIGQQVIFGFDGPKIPHELLRLDEEWGLGGYILFKRNLEEFEQLMNLTEDLWALARVHHRLFRWTKRAALSAECPNHSKFPDMIQMGQVSSVSVAYEVGAVLGRAHGDGFNMNFAPVLDLNINPDNPIIGRRAFPMIHSRLRIWQSHHSRAPRHSIIACGKHPWTWRYHSRQPEVLPTSNLTLETMRERIDSVPKLIQNHAPRHDHECTSSPIRRSR